MYTTVLLDLDLTLFDFRASEQLAFADCLHLIGLPNADVMQDEHFARYKVINHQMWAQVEAGILTPDQAGRKRFEHFLDELGVDTVDPVALSDTFQHGLGAHGELYDDAAALLDALRPHAPVAMVTNGISGVQRAKIERLGLDQWFDCIVISDEVGVSKPDPAIFDLVFAEIGEDRRARSVMVGDSLSSDIAGAQNAGIDSCWYNPARLQSPSRPTITHQIHALNDLLRLVG